MYIYNKVVTLKDPATGMEKMMTVEHLTSHRETVSLPKFKPAPAPAPETLEVNGNGTWSALESDGNARSKRITCGMDLCSQGNPASEAICRQPSAIRREERQNQQTKGGICKNGEGTSIAVPKRQEAGEASKDYKIPERTTAEEPTSCCCRSMQKTCLAGDENCKQALWCRPQQVPGHNVIDWLYA